jgi:hypothetical protein
VAINPKTLDALNYFIEEDILTCKENIKLTENNQKLNDFYRGKLVSLEEVKVLINQDWRHE